jgi:beta-glucanase (GH16 family)
MRHGAACLLACVLAAGGLSGCSEEEQPVNYGLIWQDDFDGPAGDPPDPAYWRCDLGTDWGNAQLEYDTGRAANVALDGQGHLAITARREDYGGQAYTSGRIKTAELFAQRYGRFEARLQVPVGAGLWPAFWMLGADYPAIAWPDCGEIDIMEYRGQEPRVLIGSLHGPGYSGGGALSTRHTLAQGGFNLGFHTFAVEWSPAAISWEVDGYTYQTIRPEDLPAGSRWVFDRPFFLLLNLAVGGRFVGDPDEATVFPQSLLVDRVSVYGELR